MRRTCFAVCLACTAVVAVQEAAATTIRGSARADTLLNGSPTADVMYGTVGTTGCRVARGPTSSRAAPGARHDRGRSRRDGSASIPRRRASTGSLWSRPRRGCRGPARPSGGGLRGAEPPARTRSDRRRTEPARDHGRARQLPVPSARRSSPSSSRGETKVAAQRRTAGPRPPTPAPPGGRARAQPGLVSETAVRGPYTSSDPVVSGRTNAAHRVWLASSLAVVGEETAVRDQPLGRRPHLGAARDRGCRPRRGLRQAVGHLRQRPLDPVPRATATSPTTTSRRTGSRFGAPPTAGAPGREQSRHLPMGCSGTRSTARIRWFARTARSSSPSRSRPSSRRRI